MTQKKNAADPPEAKPLCRLNDVFFKYIYKPERKRLLISLMNALFESAGMQPKYQVSDLIYNDREINADSSEGKEIRMDILATTDKNVAVNIEVQRANEHNIYERALVYSGALCSSGVVRGEDYNNFRPFIIILLLDFCLDNKRHCNWSEINYYHQAALVESPFYDLAKIIFIELPRWRRERRDVAVKDMNMLDRWLVYLTNDESRLKELIKNTPEIKEAFMSEEKFMDDRSEWLRYIKREHDQWSAIAREKKLASLEEEKNNLEEKNNNLYSRLYAAVEVMLKNGIPLDQIKHATGISETKLNEIISANN